MSDSTDFGTFGRFTETPVEKMPTEMRAASVEALITGRPVTFDDPRQQVVYELAASLVVPRFVPLGLYRRAKALLGDAGIVDVTVLIGWFTAVSLTLAAFDVPANAEGLDQ
jgi:4-carboxymuconolactone decarboxylase